MASAVQTQSTSKWQTYAVYVIMGLLTLAFALAGGTKLMGQEMHVENFIRWGYPVWFMYITGLIEVGSVILMWTPETRFYGALGLVATMLGAIVTHIVNSEPEMFPVVGILLILSGIVAWVNRSKSS